MYYSRAGCGEPRSANLNTLKPQLFQSMLMNQDTICFGTRLNLLAATCIGTPVGLKRPFT